MIAPLPYAENSTPRRIIYDTTNTKKYLRYHTEDIIYYKTRKVIYIVYVDIIISTLVMT